MRVKWRFSSTLMHLIKRLWEFYEIWVTRFVQLSCTRSNEHDSCMRVKLTDLFNSHALGQMSMRVVWELSDQFFSTLMDSVKQARELFEIELPVLFNSYALGQMSVKVVWELSDGFLQLSCTWSIDHESCRIVQWSVFLNSHAHGQTSITVVL